MLLSLNFVAFSGILIGASSLFMAALMFSLGRSRLNRIWGAFCLAVFVWGISFFFVASATTPEVARLWWKISHVGVILIPAIFIQFVYFYLGHKARLQLIVVWSLAAIFLLANIGTNLLINEMRFVFGQFYYDSPPGILYLPFFLFFQGLIIYGHYLLLRAYLASRDALQREQIRHFFMATFVGFLGGGVSFSPVFGIDIYPYTIITVTLYPIIMGYAILRFQLFEMKVVVAQITALLIFAFTFFQMFSSDSSAEYILNAGILLIAFGLGVFLVKSVRREVEQREMIEKQEKELEVINREQESLLHFISHEVKGYLTKSEAGFSAITDGTFGPISPDLKKMTGMALSEMRKGVATVMDILSASDLKKGTVSYKKDRFDFKKAVLSILEDLKPAFAEKNLSVDLSIGEGRYTVIGDEEKLRSNAIRNLIDNAIKYTPSGSIQVKLSDGDKVRFSVQDSGIGITPEDMNLLFTEGGRGKDSIKINVHSTGYGLFIAKQIIEAHGGKIWAESGGQGKGSRFIVELPVAS